MENGKEFSSILGAQKKMKSEWAKPPEDWLLARSLVTPQAIALIIGDTYWTYNQLNALVDKFAKRIIGYTKESLRVAALLPNNLAYVCLVHAVARCGAILVPLNTRLSIEELDWQLEHADCSVLVTDDDAVADYFEKNRPKDVLVINSSNLFSGDLDSSEIDQSSHEPEDIQAIVFTSGTTGKPKGAMLSFANHFYSAVASSYRLGVLKDDIWLCCLPLYHVGGLAILLRSCLYGTAVELHNGFDVATISKSLDERAISLISLVPTMVRRLLRYRGGRSWPASLRHVLIGGAPVPHELIAECHDLGIPVSVTYGLTEASSQVATMTPGDVHRKPGSAGKPLLFNRVAILSNEGRELSAQEVGEIIVSGPTVMAGYDRDETNTTRVLKEGWLHTGDVGMLDEDGDLWVLQRRDDIIISGGENIYPAEIEAILRAHPTVKQACVVGVEDQEWGQCVAAAVTPEEGATISIPELVTFCRQHLAGYKLPRRMIILPQMPLTASSKIHRRAVIGLIKDSINRC
jgi:O-succinylbenzoic acid--CoA ligase